MDEKKRTRKESGTCFEDMGFAEMRKLMGKKGAGSLCAEIVKRIVEHGECNSLCREMMGKTETEYSDTEIREERGKAEEPSRHDP
jgi:hypothetical protein